MSVWLSELNGVLLMRKRVRDHWWKWAAMNPHHFTLIRLAHNVALTTAVQPILIQQIACPTAAVEAANGIGTHLFTTSTTDITLIHIWTREDTSAISSTVLQYVFASWNLWLMVRKYHRWSYTRAHNESTVHLAEWVQMVISTSEGGLGPLQILTPAPDAHILGVITLR